jgi:hypothetical protein
MSTATPIDELLIEKLRIYLKGEGHSGRVHRWYPARARHFLDYCNDNSLAIEAVRPAHVNSAGVSPAPFAKGQRLAVPSTEEPVLSS